MKPNDTDKPPRYKPKLRAAPKLREVYYCNLWKDAHLPEFWKQRPVIVISYGRELTGVCTVIPLTSQRQHGNLRAYCLTTVITPGRESWAICNHPLTIAVSRLSLIQPRTPRIKQAELDEIILRLKQWLPL